MRSTCRPAAIRSAPRLAGRGRRTLLQTAALLRGATDSWAGQSDEALLAQGRASAQGPR